MQERAWWLHLQENLRTLKLKGRRRSADTVTFHVPLGNRIDEAVIRQFAKLRDAALTRKGDASP